MCITTGCNNIMIGCAAGTTAGALGGNHSTECHHIDMGNTQHVCARIKVAWTATSDCRDKADIQDLTAGLDFIKALRPVTYRWDNRTEYFEKDGEGLPMVFDDDGNLLEVERDGRHKGKRLHVGLLSQEVLPAEKEAGYATEEDVDSLFVKGTFNKGYGMDYERLVAPLINAVKELSAEVETLKAKVG